MAKYRIVFSVKDNVVGSKPIAVVESANLDHDVEHVVKYAEELAERRSAKHADKGKVWALVKVTKL